ncbi:hypothetical protein [Bradyrhizobium sp. 188]|uniref:hypothetical protein n=1 Tax=Bradyrhizobium sp. 188 TaxID=2782656 RepID=UPI001FFBCD71|nr:hypothetical protein [Bradyrhizobium sp. 188]MCK1499194.1 hypothetical protein [Bradyrhizobium sp. 188]
MLDQILLPSIDDDLLDWECVDVDSVRDIEPPQDQAIAKRSADHDRQHCQTGSAKYLALEAAGHDEAEQNNAGQMPPEDQAIVAAEIKLILAERAQ